MKKEKGQNQEALTQNDKPNGSTPIHPLVTGQCAEIMTYKGQSAPNPPFLATCRGSIRIWGHGSGAKENAPTVLFLCPALSCGYPIRLGYLTPRNYPMIYTFCVTRSRGPIAALPAIRTVSVYATSEAQARTQLAGLPLVFLSRSPAREVAA